MEINYSALKQYDSTPIAQQHNALVDVVQSITLGRGAGYMVKRNAAGTTLVNSNGGALATPCPFDLTVAPVSGDSSSINITVTAGTVNSLMPSNMFTTFTVALSDVTQVKLRCATDGTQVNGVTLVVDASNPVEQVPTPYGLPTSVDLVIAVVTGGIAYKVIGCGSITIIGQQQYITDVATPVQPGQLPYIPYFSWVVSTVA